MSEAMPGFSPPTSRVRLSFIAAMEEFRAEGRGTATDDTMLGREIRDFGLDWQDPERFEAYAGYLRDQAREDAPRRPGYVPSTTLWWVDGDEYLGRLAIRHRLTPRLTDLGGHIGYDVKPSARRRGHATAMLAAALPLARALGIDPALVTCDESNDGIAAGDRGQRRRAGGQARQRTALLGADVLAGPPGSADLGHDLGRDQLQVVQVVQVQHLEVDPRRAELGEGPDPVHDLVRGADQPLGALGRPDPSRSPRARRASSASSRPQQTVCAAE